VDEKKSPITLRKLKPIDSNILFEWRSHPIIWKNFAQTKPPTEASHRQWMEENTNNKTKIVYIAETHGTPVGVVKFYKFCDKKKTAWWSFYLDPSLKGHGIGALVEFRALDQYFYALSQKTLNCVVLLENQTVIKLHKRFGFVPNDGSNIESVRLDTCTDINVVKLKLTSQIWTTSRPKVSERLSKAVKKIRSIDKVV
jgi:UDP-4-amino-4,6-dideoxy-N-acetyl-beta-L-altrosamine N-acetyltransferase